MQRRATLGLIVLTLGVTGCPDALPTSSPVASRIALATEKGDADLKLYPSGFRKRAYSAWKAMEGQPDSRGEGDHALYFQKMVPTATVSAGVALFRGVEGAPPSDLTGLEWEHRNDGHCGAGAPRWNVYLRDDQDRRAVVFLGCAAAVHSPGSAPGWTRDTYAGPAIEAAPAFPFDPEAGFDRSTATLDGLAIIFDEGNDVGQGFVYLDNIKVTFRGTAHIFTGPMDNSR